MKNNNRYKQEQVILFGAGNIGRGLIGKILSESGLHVIFVDIQEHIINSIKEKKQYKIEITKINTSNNPTIETSTVYNVDAILNTPQNTPQIFEAFEHSSLIITAIGSSKLNLIASTIANALVHRFIHNKTSINIIACENKVEASTILKQEIETFLPKNFEYLNNIGFPCCTVDRIVVASNTPSKDGIFPVRVEEYFEWGIDKTAFIGNIPDIPQVFFTDTLDAYVERKLFTFNTGHAIIAYLGYIYNHTTIDQAILDKRILEVAYNAMHESSAALVAHWDFDINEQMEYVEKTITRFSNPLLKDKLIRVGRDPLRKLFFNNELITPIMLCMKYQLDHNNLNKGVAAALKFSSKEDKNALKLQQMIKVHGIPYVLEHISGIYDNELQNSIIDEYNGFE